jgi:hypothetical protein
MTKHNYLDKILTKEVLEQNYAELGSLKAVARKFDVDSGSIKKYMIIHGLDFKPQVRHSCDHDFFSRENEEVFYIAGFMAADGCVKKRKSSSDSLRYEVQISLAKSDESFLTMIKNSMKAETPIHNFLIKNSKRNPKWNDSWCSQFTITSEKMVKDLEKFNVVPAKSLIYRFPLWLINHPLCHHFMRGYNDGDGSFFVGKLQDGRTVEQIYFSLRGTVEFLTIFRAILEEKCGLDIREKSVRENTGIGVLEYGGNGVISKIADYLYRDATIYLPRKREIAMMAKQFQGLLK